MSSLLRAIFTGTSKHKKLSEEWATLREPVVEGVTFHCKYLGSTIVDDPKGEAATAEAIKRVIATAKLVARKPERVALHVSLKGIRMDDTLTKETLLQTSIYKISYCSADAHYDHVFAFIATTDNDTCECHAFLCPKRKMAQAVTISIAQAFNLAYECWKVSLDGTKEDQETYGHEELPAEVTVGSAAMHSGARSSMSQPSSLASSPIPIRSDSGSSDMSTSGYQSSSQAVLIDLEDSQEHPGSHGKIPALGKPLNTLDDLGDISDGFSRLALRRGNPPQRLSGMSHLGLDEACLAAAFTGHQAASPTESGSWPSTSPSQAASPLAASPPDPWAALGRSPPEAWEMFSRSPNTAFLHSCQSPPSSSSMFPSTMQSPPPPFQLLPQSVQSLPPPFQSLPPPFQSLPQSVQSLPQSLQSPHSIQSPLHPVQSLPQVVQSPPQSPQSPLDTNPFPFPSQGCLGDPFSAKPSQDVCGSSAQPPFVPLSPSPATPTTGRDNPFLPTTNPFLSAPAPGREVPTSPHVESPRVVVSPAGSGCSPGRPVWTADLFSGAKSKNVICS